MSYDTTHPMYDKQRELWEFMHDSLDGGAIKHKKQRYLKKTNGQLEIEATIERGIRLQMNPEFSLTDVEKLYEAYSDRAKYPHWVKDQLRTMMGLCSNLPMKLDVPPELQDIEHNATQDGLTLRQLFQRVVSGLLTYGRYALVPDLDEDGKIFIRHYEARQFINWKVKNVRGRQDVTLAVFQELRDSEEDPFDHTFDIIYRAFIYDGNGCMQQVWQDGALLEERYLGFTESPIPYVPVVIAGSTQNSVDIDELPLLTVAEAALTYYQKSADVNQALHDGCSFQTVVFGLDDNQDIGYTGGGTIWTLPSKDRCDAKILEPTFQNLQVAIDEMNKQKDIASEAGAKVIDLGVESGEARIARQRDQYATLRSIVMNAADAIQQALRYGQELTIFDRTATPQEIHFHVETEFSEAGIDVNMLKELQELAIVNKISWGSVWEYIQDGIVPKRSYVDEQMLIEAEQSGIILTPSDNHQPPKQGSNQ